MFKKKGGNGKERGELIKKINIALSMTSSFHGNCKGRQMPYEKKRVKKKQPETNNKCQCELCL